MSNISSKTASDDTRTARHALEATYLLHSIAGGSALSTVQSLRARDLKQGLARSERKKVRGSTTCSYCGAIVVPGWTGNMSSVMSKPGKRRRGRMTVEEPKPKPRQNHLEWSCDTCGYITCLAGSDPNTKEKFKKVKKQPPLSTVLRSLAASPSIATDSARTVYASTARQASTAFSMQMDEAPTVLSQSPKPPSLSVIRTQPKVPAAVPNQPEARSAQPLPANASQKKRRSKKEGLQAMLQAKKDQEKREKQASSGLGLAGFLKGLHN
jgi:hypothetical protein